MAKTVDTVAILRGVRAFMVRMGVEADVDYDAAAGEIVITSSALREGEPKAAPQPAVSLMRPRNGRSIASGQQLKRELEILCTTPLEDLHRAACARSMEVGEYVRWLVENDPGEKVVVGISALEAEHTDDELALHMRWSGFHGTLAEFKEHLARHAAAHGA